jgi:hypothetical protein
MSVKRPFKALFVYGLYLNFYILVSTRVKTGLSTIFEHLHL